MAFGETIGPDEEARFRGYADELRGLQEARAAERGGKKQRALHVKQHLGAVGELVVTAAEPAQHGVFSEAGKSWPVYVRFSNGGSRAQGDKQPDVRGFALKLVGVPGPKLIEGLQDAQTQDFLFIDTQALPFRDPAEFMMFQRAAKDGPGPLLPRLIASFGFARALKILWGAVTKAKVESYATHAFHTAAPIAFGNTAAKLALFPDEPDAGGESVTGDDYLRRDLSARLARGTLRWTLRAQLFVDAATTPIEDTAVAWSGPWLDLAVLSLPQQSTDSARGREISELVSELSFDPWHATEEHRPLGAIMRARKITYGASVIGRGAAPEPTSVLAH